MACSGVSPSEWHPGRSGYSIKNPPPSSAESGRIVNGYLSNLANSVMLGILQLANKLYKVTHVPGLDRDVLRDRCSARPRVPECHMACAALTVNVHPEATRDNFQILHAPVAEVPPHTRKDLLGIGHDYMVPNTAPWNNAACLTNPAIIQREFDASLPTEPLGGREEPQRARLPVYK